MDQVSQEGWLDSGAWLNLDLLRERRQRSGSEKPTVVPARQLLLRGALIGSVLPVLLLLTSLALFWQSIQLDAREDQLAPIAAEHDRLEIELIAATKSLEQSKAVNQKMATAMGDVRSTSALLGEMRRLVPQSMTFEQLAVRGNMLEISGTALQPDGLRVVNALLLRLARSSFFVPSQVVLAKADTTETDMQALVKFSASAGFAGDAPALTRQRLMDLGAEGLSRRLDVLVAEGLLP